MNTNWESFCMALAFAGSLLWSGNAAAEVALVEKDGWTFSFDGRVGAFLSVGVGDDFPTPTPNPSDPTYHHEVMGSKGGSLGVPDVGWVSSSQQDADNKYFSMRVRSGLIGNVLGFGLKRTLTPNSYLKAYISIWSTIESLGRDKWKAIDAEAREGYASAVGPWGSATLGRTWGLFGRMSAEIDLLYGHGYGVGLPCTDQLGPACGHTGTGVAYPGYSAGFSYSTPSFSGFQVHAGIYDPIVFGDFWKRAPYLRPEAALSFETRLGTQGKLRLEAEGLYQPLDRVVDAKTDTVSGATVPKHDASTSVWGVAGGARLEFGPVRFGAAAFRGRGIGLSYALHYTSASLNEDTYELRTFTGFYGQAALVFGGLQIAAGAGVASCDQLASDRSNPKLSVIQRQLGASAAIYYHLTDSVVLGIDYFRFMARWYGAPRTVFDQNSMQSQLTAQVLPAEKQDLNFINAGVTYHW